MRTGKLGQRREQRAVVLYWFGHFVVEALMVLPFDPVLTEWDSLSDEDSGAGLAVIVGELHAWHRDGEFRRARQCGEAHLRFHLRLPAVPCRVVEVAGELDEKVGRQIRRGPVVANRHDDLASRAPAGGLTELGYAGDGVVAGEDTRSPKRIGEEPGAPVVQRGSVGWKCRAIQVAGEPT